MSRINRISLSSHAAVMAEQTPLQKTTKDRDQNEKKNKKTLTLIPASATFIGFKCHSNYALFGALRWPPASMVTNAAQL